MKRWIMVAAAAVALAAFSGTGWASGTDIIWQTDQLQWKEVGAIVFSDTTRLGDEADTTRTSIVDTSKWAWDALGALGAVQGIAMVTFVSEPDGAQVPAATDTIYFTIEKNSGRDSTFAVNGTLAAAVGSCAIGNGTAGNRVFTGLLVADSDVHGVNNIFLVPRFRLRVAGDQSGTSPVLPNLKAYITYPIRAQSR